MSNQHPKGYPYSVRTYNSQKCRCERCRAANAADQRRRRRAAKKGNQLTRSAAYDLARGRAETRAARWVREHRPKVWEQIMAEALAETGHDELPDRRSA